MTFATTHGTTNIRAKWAAFVSAFARRVETGLLAGAPASRTRYRVMRKQENHLQFRAETFWTAINVGLNDVDLAVDPDGRVTYTIRFPIWARYCIGMGVFLAVVLGIVFMLIDVRNYIAEHSASRLPGLSIDQNVRLAWTMAVFWGLIWPWILVALHKRPLRRLMNRLISEVDAAAMSGT